MKRRPEVPEELYQAMRHSVASVAASSGVSIAIIKGLGHTDMFFPHAPAISRLDLKEISRIEHRRKPSTGLGLRLSRSSFK